MATNYNCRPSTLLDIEDSYTAYCFDEACTYIKEMIKRGEEPVFSKKYKSFTDMYKDVLNN